jgi:hypothetical protein
VYRPSCRAKGAPAGPSVQEWSSLKGYTPAFRGRSSAGSHIVPARTQGNGAHVREMGTSPGSSTVANRPSRCRHGEPATSRPPGEDTAGTLGTASIAPHDAYATLPYANTPSGPGPAGSYRLGGRHRLG